MRLFLALLTLALVPVPSSQTHITSPKEEFGFNIGDDYQLANYTKIAAYWKKLDAQSDRLVVQEIGKTAEGRPQLMAIVTSPENHRNLAKYKDISRRLALAEAVGEDDARRLAKEGKAVVWIDGGLHATETLGAQQLVEMIYQMVSRTDEETMRFLNDCVVLFVHANPDGNELVADWYMRHPVPGKRSFAGLPRLYQKYIGHDNNRDFFASTQAETENINRVLYHEWVPQILYNHHQSGPAGTVVWSSPQRDPYNFNLDPLLILGLQALGTHMHQRLAAEGKPGATMASGGAYDGWWNGGIRNTGNFHNIIAILTETIGSPTPMRIPLVIQRQIPNRDLPYPIAPQEWRFKQSVDYSISFDRAVIDYASRNREHLLYNIYKMGQRAIERGSQDTWTPSPTRLQAAAERLGTGGGRGGAADAERESEVWASLRTPELRDPRGYIIPSDQPDFLTAIKFINALREVNVTVLRATRSFEIPSAHAGVSASLAGVSSATPGAGGAGVGITLRPRKARQDGARTYPAGSFIVMTAQAFRPHVLDMFEPQDHPNVIPYPGAPPTPPYDNAGWTLAFQMGVEFDRILEPFSGPFEKVTDWNVAPPPGRVTTTTARATRYTFKQEVNDAAIAVNRLLAAGADVYWGFSTGPSASTTSRVQQIAKDVGVSFEPSGGESAPLPKLRAPRIGLWDQYGGSMESGWTRWILEQFQFPFARVYAPELDAGNLNAKYDALIFPNGGIPSASGGGRGGRGGRGADPGADDIPAEYRSQIGRVTIDRTLPNIRAFIEGGGTVIAIGDSAANLAAALKLPIEDHLVENGAPLPRSKYFVPGSVLTARVDVSAPVARGMSERTDFFFDNSPVFKLGAGAKEAGIRAIAWFDTPTPLHSGWAWGQKYLDRGVVAIEAPLGKGHVLLYGPEILERAQPHGTFKLLFNALFASAAERRPGENGR
jgi:Zinc carboxypeptidase